DHGKTTLTDAIMRQTGQVPEGVSMDSNALERERGITILAKNTSVRVKDTKINIVDTPGHADFGGEVERIIGMVDGALLLVDAAEGPLPQTRFVLQKALKAGLKIILVINKVDRPECTDGTRIQEVVNHAFDLFFDLDASEEQMDFPIVYACARQGWCTTEFNDIRPLIEGKKTGSLEPLFDLILDNVPPPPAEASVQPEDFRMLISNLTYSDYVGRLAVGRILAGSIKKNQRIQRKSVNAFGAPISENFTVSRLYTFEGLKQTEVEILSAGDIGVLAGSELVEIGDTLTGADVVQALPRISVEPPTLAMLFSVNTSPLSGQEGEAVQSRKLRDRLIREVRNNVALRFEETALPDQFRVLGRGELQFAILIEQMRREGCEFMIGKPLVLFKQGTDGERLEPMEKTVLDLPEDFASEVTALFQQRKGILSKYDLHPARSVNAKSRVRLEFDIPTRGLLGIRSRYLTVTRGEGLFSSQLLGYAPYKGEIPHRTSGALISDRSGSTVEYGLLGLEDRGVLFLGPGVPVYEGMIIGEFNKENDLNVNPCREKKLTNIRAAHAELLVTLSGIKKMSLEQCIEWLDEDEWIEVTPQSIRLRKKVLSSNLRSIKRSERLDG
ncbi:MAG TPA: translational GTPase TypA, partial [Bdellovibrionales bacterium]|nr:translational GTPase TypA [Bdellovibrionales bacterium]